MQSHVWKHQVSPEAERSRESLGRSLCYGFHENSRQGKANSFGLAVLNHSSGLSCKGGLRVACCLAWDDFPRGNSILTCER